MIMLESKSETDGHRDKEKGKKDLLRVGGEREREINREREK